MTNVSVSIIILSFNRKDDLYESLNRLQQQENPDCEIIVVENASTDGSGEMVSQHFPDVLLLPLKKNIGIAGWNRGLESARGEYILMLDDDSFPADGAVQKMVTAFKENPAIGVVAFDVRNYEKYDEISTAPSLSPTPENGKKIHNNKKYLMGFNGAGVGFRKSLLDRVGGYDEDFFLYWNETDIAIRILETGSNIVEFPDIVAYHKYSPKNRASKRGPFYYTRNLYWITWKYFPWQKIITHTARLLYLSVYYSLEQGTGVYLQAAFSALFSSYKIFKKRAPVKREIIDNMRITHRLAFILYR